MLREIDSLAEFDAHLATHGDLEQVVFQGVDLTARTQQILGSSLLGSVFLGCDFEDPVLRYLHAQAGLARAPIQFPRFPDLVYRVYRNRLYTPEELLGDYVPGRPETYATTLDDLVYQRFVATREAQPIMDTLAQRMHDHAIDAALHDLLTDGDVPKRVVAIMGGHSMLRGSSEYRAVVEISRELTRRGFFLASGGGPGAMEATNLGAWFATRGDDELSEAIALLSEAAHYDPKERWLDQAFLVRARFPLRDGEESACASLGIPTWLYGHEPPNVFATHIAKYFANSIREEGLLAIAHYGVIFSPGSAGTIQEIFMDACQNHYKSFGTASPMVFFGEGYWKWKKPVYPLAAELAAGREYAKYMAISDDPAAVVDAIVRYAEEIDGET